MNPHLRRLGSLSLAGSLIVAGTVVGAAPPDEVVAQISKTMQVVDGQLLANLTNDTDNDGIFDEREDLLGTNPTAADSDADGFDDLFEDNHRDFGFDPNDPLSPDLDSDADGLSDRIEVNLHGTDPTCPDSEDTLAPDSDGECNGNGGDGLSDFDEVLNSFFGYDPITFTVDADFDGLADSLESSLGTSTTNTDSDGDGASDFQEYKAGLAPATSDPGEFTEIVGRTFSDAMDQALEDMRLGNPFPTLLASQLPYPEVTAPLISGGILQPSAALMQLSVFNPGGSVPLYDDFGKIKEKLQDAAQTFDGDPKPNIVRLFRWSEKTALGRRVYALKISDNPQNNEKEPEILYLSMHHARELVTTSIATGLIKELTEKYETDKRIKKMVDNLEIWIIPVVNPDGYEFSVKAAKQVWRKNLRKVSIGEDPKPAPVGGAQTWFGVDLNRNYGFEHIRDVLSPFLGDGVVRLPNGLTDPADPQAIPQPNPNSETYAGKTAFSEVETQAVKGLVENTFASGNEVDGLKCSLSWHTAAGEVAHAFSHAKGGLPAADAKRFKDLSEVVAKATGYTNFGGEWENARNLFGRRTGYPVFGDSEDWLYAGRGDAKKIFALLVEAYSAAERGGTGSFFFPETVPKRDAVVKNNIKGALAFANACLPDFGDAPDPHRNPPHTPQEGTPGKYPSRLENEGARHLDFSLEFLGDIVDGEADADVERDGLDQDQDGLDGDLHDDGVVFGGPIAPGEPFSISVTVSVLDKDITEEDGTFRYNSGDPEKRLYLNAWADWNGDGVWETPGEMIIGFSAGNFAIDPRNDPEFAAGNSGTYQFNLVAPTEIARNSYLRFRLDYGEDVGEIRRISPSLVHDKGAAQFGEVEDFLGPQPPVGGIGFFQVADGSSGPKVGVLAGIVAGATTGIATLGGAAWYVRRRWLG